MGNPLGWEEVGIIQDDCWGRDGTGIYTSLGRGWGGLVVVPLGLVGGGNDQ